MKFAEAMAAMEQGKKVRHSGMADGDYLHLNNFGSIICGSYRELKDLSHESFKRDWEVYNESVEAGTLKDGDLFVLVHSTNYKYRLLPAYMLQYVKDVHSDACSPCYDERDGSLLYVRHDLKVIKVNE